MSLASSSGGGHNLAQIFDNLLQQENQEIGIPMESEMMQAAREGPFESNVELEESDSRADDQSGVKPTRKEDTAMEMGLDFSALAMQLLEQAQAQGLLTGSGQQSKEEEEDSNNQQQSEEPVPNCSSAASEESAQNKSASNAGIPSKSRSSGHSGSRRSGSKSLLSAAAAAALLAPSPLGQIPSIPGAIAVAVSPAAQLFREDDWSWHRNPAAAIRSGGLNKQTPVWKYFVYNKTENLSRCIVGNCTYQLKGPHTSTLACHLKKHPAEHAEFQRLKSEYTRERIAAGHGQAGGQQDGGGGEGGSGCSTPISSQSNNNGFLLPTTSRQPQSSESRRKTSHSPSALGCPFPSVVPADPCQQQNIGDGGDDSSGAGSSSLSCTSSPEPAQQFSWIPPHHDQQQHQQHPQMSAGPAPPNGGGGIFAGLPPISGFHHFMMAAALAASQQHNSNGRHQEQLQRHQQKQTPHNSADEQPQGQSSGGDGGLSNGGGGIQQQPPGTGKLMPLNELNGGGGCCTGANLLGILNLLSTRAAQLEEEEDIKEKQLIISNQSAGQCRAKSQELLKSQGGAENEAEEEQMQRRRGRKRAASSGGGPERGDEAEANSTTGADAATTADQPRETVSSSRRGGMAPPQHPPGLAAHSVEHLLSRGGGGGVPSSIGASSRPRDSPPPLAPQMDTLLNGLALSLGTGLPRHELCHLLQNPFLGGCWTGLSLGRVDRVLDQHLKLLKRQMGDQLARADPGAMALMAELSCARCWNVPFGNQCLVKGCDGPSQFWCSLSVSFRPAKPGGQRRSLLLAVRQVGAEAMTSRLEEIMAHLNLPKNIRPSLLLIRPMHLANLKFPCKIRCLPALFPDCLEWAFREALVADESMDRLLEAFLRMLETFSSSWQGQNEWRALTGQHLGPLPALTKEDHGQQKMSLLAIAEIVLQWREEFVEIAARHATLEVEETLLSQEEWRLLAELVRLLTVFRSEMRKGEGHNRIRLGQISSLLEDVHRRLQNEFKALDDFPEKLSAILRGKTDEWMTERAKSLSAELLNIPCAPVSLSEVFGRNGNGREWIGEEERWLERSTLLLFNNDLLKEDGPEASASGSN